MTYVRSEAERAADELMSRVHDEMGREFAGKLSDAHCRVLTEHEDAAVILHGKQILATIEGRGFGSTAGPSLYEDDSILVPALERIMEAS
jgi:wyosine [tRNA(Phe)-imidazoG37] synthetase (radical SAM superfamily)